MVSDPRLRPFLRARVNKLSDDASKLKSTGFFTLSGPDGKKTDPIPYDAPMEEIQRSAHKAGLRVEDLWGSFQ